MSATIVSQMPRNPCHSQATTHICFLSSSSVLWHFVKDKGRGQVHQALLARLAGLEQGMNRALGPVVNVVTSSSIGKDVLKHQFESQDCCEDLSTFLLRRTLAW